MATDALSAQPIRTEGDATEKVQVRILDKSVDANQLAIESNGNAQVKVHGQDPSATDQILRTSEQGSASVDGVYDASLNTDPSNSGLIASQRAASPADSDQIKRVTAISSGSVHALDISLHDESGNPYSETNPLPVNISETEGTPINDFKDAASIVSGASDNHDYTVTALKTLWLTQVEWSASGKARMELKIETGVATNVFTSKFVQFNSASDQNASIILKEPIAVAAGVRVRLSMTNKEPGQPQDLYSTICGHEV